MSCFECRQEVVKSAVKQKLVYGLLPASIIASGTSTLSEVSCCLCDNVGDQLSTIWLQTLRVCTIITTLVSKLKLKRDSAFFKISSVKWSLYCIATGRVNNQIRQAVCRPSGGAEAGAMFASMTSTAAGASPSSRLCQKISCPVAGPGAYGFAYHPVGKVGSGGTVQHI